jgi:FixJ family two-component response regulator
MTGYARVDTAVEAIELGAMDHESKPLDVGRLQQMLVGRTRRARPGDRILTDAVTDAGRREAGRTDMTQARVDALRDGPAPPGRPGDTILVVDDEAAVRELMGRWLRAQGHQVVCVSSADEALAIAAAETPAIALCDIRMPGRDGLWLASRLRLDYPDTAVIMATGVNDVSAAVASLRHGVVDYLTKPFGRDRLRDAVVRALEWHRAARDLRHWREALERDSDARRTTLSHLVNQQPIESAAAVEAFIGRLALHYPEAVAHARRVAELAAAIADRLDVGTNGAQVLRFGALLHDLGKLALPDCHPEQAGAPDAGRAGHRAPAPGRRRAAPRGPPVPRRGRRDRTKRTRASGRSRVPRGSRRRGAAARPADRRRLGRVRHDDPPPHLPVGEDASRRAARDRPVQRNPVRSPAWPASSSSSGIADSRRGTHIGCRLNRRRARAGLPNPRDSP